MRHMRTVAVPATTREFVHHTTCDLCGARIKEGANQEIDEITVLRKAGHSDTDSEYNTVELDEVYNLCGGCFDNKLVPWLKSQGAEPRPGGRGW